MFQLEIIIRTKLLMVENITWPSNVLNKLARASFKVTELMDIANAFDYEIKLMPKSCDRALKKHA